jgi:hypothetical protein
MGMVLIIPGFQPAGGKSAGKSTTKSGNGATAPAATKAGSEPGKPLFNTLPVDNDSPIRAAPAPATTPNDIPITRVEDVPPVKKP